jgi:hypothetical protein
VKTPEQQSDFQSLGFSSDVVHPAERLGIVSIDYEAFPLGRMDLWFAAMEGFTVALERWRLPFSVFLSVEDMVRLRHEESDSYRTLIAYLNRWWHAGSRVYPHNHYAFDLVTGDMQEQVAFTREEPVDYGKRKSFFHHAVNQCGLDLSDWLASVFRVYDEIVAEIAERPATARVFRAGGWDYGSGTDDLALYLNALRSSGVEIDSSACCGRFGKSDWRVGLAFSKNLFYLGGDILEAAPTWSLNMDGNPWKMRRLLQLAVGARRQELLGTGKGLLNVVLHFDHLLHDWEGSDVHYFGVVDRQKIASAASRWVATLALAMKVLRIRPVTFDELRCFIPR